MSLLKQRELELLGQTDEKNNLFVFVHSEADKDLWFEVNKEPMSNYVNLLPKDEQIVLNEIAPYIIKIEEKNYFSQWLLDNENLMKDAFFIRSSEPLEEISVRFKYLLYCRDERGRLFYFSFYRANIFIVYISYLRHYEPDQCKALLMGIDEIYFKKELFLENIKEKLSKQQLYGSVASDDFLNKLSGGISPVSNYLKPSFFNYFSRVRIKNYKNRMYKYLSDKYPDRKFSMQEKSVVFEYMDNVISSVKKYGITNEKAVGDLLESIWMLDEDIINYSDVKMILKRREAQKYRTEYILNLAKGRMYG